MIRITWVDLSRERVTDSMVSRVCAIFSLRLTDLGHKDGKAHLHSESEEAVGVRRQCGANDEAFPFQKVFLAHRPRPDACHQTGAKLKKAKKNCISSHRNRKRDHFAETSNPTGFKQVDIAPISEPRSSRASCALTEWASLSEGRALP